MHNYYINQSTITPFTTFVCNTNYSNEVCLSGSTRTVRGSDYSPASELFSSVRKLDRFNAHKKIGQILSIHSRDIERKQNSDVN